MQIRYGVHLSPLKARMLDMIRDTTRGRGGITREALAWVFFGGVPKRDAENRVKSHVWQLNELLEETEYKIINRDGTYRLVKRGHI